MKNRESVKVGSTTHHPTCDAPNKLYSAMTGAKCPWAASIFVGDKGYCRSHTAEAQAAIDAQASVIEAQAESIIQMARRDE